MRDESEAPSSWPHTKEDKAEFASELRHHLDTHRHDFVVDEMMFEPSERYAHRLLSYAQGSEKRGGTHKLVSAACLKLLLDYCEGDWPMDFVSYCAGIFHGREPKPDETAFDLLPDVRKRVTADRLGFGHIYGSKP